jgi:hypothetical protein
LTLGQKVKLSVGKEEIAKLSQNKVVVFETTTGKHQIIEIDQAEYDKLFAKG